MLSLLALLLPNAEAFCGTYVGGVGAEFYNEYSQVAIVRDGNQTALTVYSDPVVSPNNDSMADNYSMSDNSRLFGSQILSDYSSLVNSC